MQAEFAQIEKPPPQRQAARQAGGLPRNGAGHAARPFLFSLSLSDEWVFVFYLQKSDIKLCAPYATVSTTFMRSILPVQSLVWARQQRAGGEEMNPQLPVKVNSALLNGMQQYVLITRLFKASLITWCLRCPPHPTHPIPTPRPPPRCHDREQHCCFCWARPASARRHPECQAGSWAGWARSECRSECGTELRQSETEWGDWRRGMIWPLAHRGRRSILCAAKGVHDWFVCAAHRVTTAPVWSRPLQLCSGSLWLL